MIMQLTSVVAELFRSGDDQSTRRSLMLHSLSSVHRALQSLSNTRTIQLQVLVPIVTVASATIDTATEDSLYQYLSALAQLNWVSVPPTGAERVDFGYEIQASDFLTVVLNQTEEHARFMKQSKDASTRAVSGTVQGLPTRSRDFGPAMAMALTQIHYNQRSSFAGTRTMKPNYAVLS